MRAFCAGCDDCRATPEYGRGGARCGSRMAARITYIKLQTCSWDVVLHLGDNSQDRELAMNPLTMARLSFDDPNYYHSSIAIISSFDIRRK